MDCPFVTAKESREREQEDARHKQNASNAHAGESNGQRGKGEHCPTDRSRLQREQCQWGQHESERRRIGKYCGRPGDASYAFLVLVLERIDIIEQLGIAIGYECSGGVEDAKVAPRPAVLGDGRETLKPPERQGSEGKQGENDPDPARLRPKSGTCRLMFAVLFRQSVGGCTCGCPRHGSEIVTGLHVRAPTKEQDVDSQCMTRVKRRSTPAAI